MSRGSVVSDYVHLWCKYVKRARLLVCIYSVHM